MQAPAQQGHGADGSGRVGPDDPADNGTHGDGPDHSDAGSTSAWLAPTGLPAGGRRVNFVMAASGSSIRHGRGVTVTEYMRARAGREIYDWEICRGPASEGRWAPLRIPGDMLWFIRVTGTDADTIASEDPIGRFGTTVAVFVCDQDRGCWDGIIPMGAVPLPVAESPGPGSSISPG